MSSPVVELPSGIVTFVFTDIEGSTRLFYELGEGYIEVLDEHRRILRDAWSSNRGVEVSTDGDAFFVAFTKMNSPHSRSCRFASRIIS